MWESISFLIIVLTIAISLIAWRSDDLLSKLTMNPYRIAHKKEYWRFVTSGFIHADFTHLFFNMFSFFFFGLQLEQIFSILFPGSGMLLYVIFYLLAIVVADLPTYFKQSKNPYYNSLGASGAVSAVIFAGILFFPVEKIYLFGLIGIPGFIYAGLFTWYSIAMDKRGGGFVNHSAHLYGGIFGLVFMTILYPSAWITFFQQIKTMIW
ncbi:MAG: rhomboid family intramembrane serine protease [Aquirufa sp.]